MKKWIYLLFVLFGISCIQQANINLQLDNPSLEDCRIKVNGKEYTVPANAVLDVKVREGENEIEVLSGKLEGKKAKIELNEEGLLNISGEEYILWKEIYTNDLEHNKLLNERTIVIEGNEYYGDFIIYPADQFYIPREWQFQLNEAFPDTMAYDPDSGYTFAKKIFRKADFLTAYENYYGAADYDPVYDSTSLFRIDTIDPGADE